MDKKFALSQVSLHLDLSHADADNANLRLEKRIGKSAFFGTGAVGGTAMLRLFQSARGAGMNDAVKAASALERYQRSSAKTDVSVSDIKNERAFVAAYLLLDSIDSPLSRDQFQLLHKRRADYEAACDWIYVLDQAADLLNGDPVRARALFDHPEFGSWIRRCDRAGELFDMLAKREAEYRLAREFLGKLEKGVDLRDIVIEYLQHAEFGNWVGLKLVTFNDVPVVDLLPRQLRPSAVKIISEMLRQPIGAAASVAGWPTVDDVIREGGKPGVILKCWPVLTAPGSTFNNFSDVVSRLRQEDISYAQMAALLPSVRRHAIQPTDAMQGLWWLEEFVSAPNDQERAAIMVERPIPGWVLAIREGGKTIDALVGTLRLQAETVHKIGGAVKEASASCNKRDDIDARNMWSEALSKTGLSLEQWPALTEAAGQMNKIQARIEAFAKFQVVSKMRDRLQAASQLPTTYLTVKESDLVEKLQALDVLADECRQLLQMDRIDERELTGIYLRAREMADGPDDPALGLFDEIEFAPGLSLRKRLDQSRYMVSVREELDHLIDRMQSTSALGCRQLADALSAKWKAVEDEVKDSKFLEDISNRVRGHSETLKHKEFSAKSFDFLKRKSTKQTKGIGANAYNLCDCVTVCRIVGAD